jgi:phosphoribosylformimino-5-aminoimidazole carboxamide ribotide isomerase
MCASVNVRAPARDRLIGGRVVRLRQGDFAQETAYSDDPASVARSFAADGATWLHVVDLDGARAGEPKQAAVLAAIAAAVPATVRVEAAGGLRSEAAVAPRWTRGHSAWRSGPRRSAIRGSRVAPWTCTARNAWSRPSTSATGWHSARDGAPGAPGLPAAEAVALLADAGIETFEVTAIDRDGLLGGPDLGPARARSLRSVAGGSSRPEVSPPWTTCGRRGTPAAPARSWVAPCTRVAWTWLRPCGRSAPGMASRHGLGSA